MIQKYYPYWEWEDYINGMYETDINECRVNNSVELLSNPVKFKNILL